MYKVLWGPQVCKTFTVIHEKGNEHDRHAYRDEEPGLMVGQLDASDEM